MATKNFTPAQVKELLDMHENTIIKCFTTQIDRLETKLNIQAQENRDLRQEVFELKKRKMKINWP